MPAVWPWILGIRKTKELLYTGNMMDAQEAWRLGLVNKVVPNDKLEEEVNKLAQTVAKVPAVNNEFSKRLVNMAYDLVNIRSVMERSGELEAISLTASAVGNTKKFRLQTEGNLSLTGIVFLCCLSGGGLRPKAVVPRYINNINSFSKVSQL